MLALDVGQSGVLAGAGVPSFVPEWLPGPGSNHAPVFPPAGMTGSADKRTVGLVTLDIGSGSEADVQTEKRPNMDIT